MSRLAPTPIDLAAGCARRNVLVTLHAALPALCIAALLAAASVPLAADDDIAAPVSPGAPSAMTPEFGAATVMHVTVPP